MKPIIELQRVGQTYPGPPPVYALRETDLALNFGEYISLAGPSGSGKSTLLNVLGLMRQPTVGRVLVDGEDISRSNDQVVSRIRGQRLGFVFQSFNLLQTRSAAENVELPLLYAGVRRKERRIAAHSLLARLGLDDRAHALPHELSGGERQRVALARAVIRRPDVLICDEPTGNLDESAMNVVLDILADLNAEGMAVVVVTHNSEVAGRAQRQYTLTHGSLKVS